jgi:hypothetical protein
MWRLFFVSVWTRSPQKPTTATDTISVDHQPVAITYTGASDASVDPHGVDQDHRADALTAKTLFASDIFATNKAWMEKEVS